ncbi:hypothetical protein BJV74DRAFT_520964 [Russula compacta]|nr:hypothetical protein BJV74DRAFT_520964 [Russula compacta]
MIAVTVVALIMFLRVRALYAECLSVQVFVLSILFTFIGVNSWLLTRGVPVPHPAYPLVDSCTMIIDPNVPGPLASSTAWLPLLYDTVVIFLTINGTARYIQSKGTGQMFRALLREGLLYYSVICSVTLVFTIMIIFAEPSVRNITGQLQVCLTVAMMSRITIHFRRFARPNGVIHDGTNHRPFIHQLFSPNQVATIGLPTFVKPGVPSSQNVMFLQGPPNGTVVVPGNGSYFAMETFSTMTSDAGEPYLQNPQEPPGVLVGDNYVVSGTG